MSCLFGHKWNGCKCERCGKSRDKGHDFCAVEEKCETKCTRCGAISKTEHQWKNGVCKVCDAQKPIVKTAGSCCVCGKSLVRQVNQSGKLDDVARFCTSCGTDICVFCLKKLPGEFEKKCPVCGKILMFEINPMLRP